MKIGFLHAQQELGREIKWEKLIEKEVKVSFTSVK